MTASLEQLEQRLNALTEEHRQLSTQVAWLLSHRHIGIQSSEPVHIKYGGEERAYADGSEVLVQVGEATQPLEGEA